jgi:hypothetical protein
MYVAIQPLVSLIAGIMILMIPRLLNYIVAIYLIVIGILGLAKNVVGISVAGRQAVGFGYIKRVDLLATVPQFIMPKTKQGKNRSASAITRNKSIQ